MVATIIERRITVKGSHPPSLANEYINCLQCADVIVVLRQSPVGLQRVIKALANYIELQGLELNMRKTKVVRLVDSNFKMYNWYIKGEQVEPARSYTYMGIHLGRLMSITNHTMSLQAKAHSLIFAFKLLKKKLSCPSYSYVLTVMAAQLIPSLTYGRARR